MIKLIYKEKTTIEFENLADVIAFVEHFNPPDKIDTMFGDEEKNIQVNLSQEEIPSTIFYKNHKIYKSLNADAYHVMGPGITNALFLTLEMAKSAIDMWEDANKQVLNPIPFEKEVGKPENGKSDVILGKEFQVCQIKKRGRPKKEHSKEDVKELKDLGNTKVIESIKEPSIMGIDDVAKELSKTNMMLFTEEALRKIFQKAYKPALKTDVKAVYPLTQLDPQMCNTFVSEVSNKLGIKCTLSYKVGKTGFTYVLIK